MYKYNASFALLLLAVSGLTACDLQQEYRVSSYRVSLEVQRDGSYHVRERIRFNFGDGSHDSAHRAIPLEDIDLIRIIRVNSPQTTIDSVVARQEKDVQHVRWYYPDRSKPALFTLDYSVTGALYEQNRRNIVDWDAIGPGWSVPVDSVRTEVILPGSFAADRDSISAAPEAGAIMRIGGQWLISFRRGELLPCRAYRVLVSFPREVEGRPRSAGDSAAGAGPGGGAGGGGGAAA